MAGEATSSPMKDRDGEDHVIEVLPVESVVGQQHVSRDQCSMP
jgi:hypothetical protein